MILLWDFPPRRVCLIRSKLASIRMSGIRRRPAVSGVAGFAVGTISMTAVQCSTRRRRSLPADGIHSIGNEWRKPNERPGSNVFCNLPFQGRPTAERSSILYLPKVSSWMRSTGRRDATVRRSSPPYPHLCRNSATRRFPGTTGQIAFFAFLHRETHTAPIRFPNGCGVGSS